MAQAEVLGSAARGARWWLLAWFLLWWVVMAGGGVWFAILPVLNLLTVALTILIWPRGELVVGLTLLGIVDGLVVAYAIAAMGYLGLISIAMMSWAVVCFGLSWLALWMARGKAARAAGEFGEAAAAGLVRRTTALALLLMFAGGATGYATNMVRAAPKERAYQAGIERLLAEVFAAPQPLTWSYGFRAYVRPEDRDEYIHCKGDYYIRVEARRVTPSRPDPDPKTLRAEVRVGLGASCLPLKDAVYTPDDLVGRGIFRPGFAAKLKPDRAMDKTVGVLSWSGHLGDCDVSYHGLGSSVELTIVGPLP